MVDVPPVKLEPGDDVRLAAFVVNLAGRVAWALDRIAHHHRGDAAQAAEVILQETKEFADSLGLDFHREE